MEIGVGIKNIIRTMVLAGFGRMTTRNRAVMERALAAIEGGNDWEFDLGQRVERLAHEGVLQGTVVSRYRTTTGEPCYVVEVSPQLIQVIAMPEQLRAIQATPAPPVAVTEDGDRFYFQRQAERILARLRRELPPDK